MVKLLVDDSISEGDEDNVSEGSEDVVIVGLVDGAGDTFTEGTEDGVKLRVDDAITEGDTLAPPSAKTLKSFIWGRVL